MAATPTADPINEVLQAAAAIFRASGRAGQTSNASRAAERLAIDAVLEVADHLEAWAGARLSSQDIFALSRLRRTVRRYALHSWHTAPEFLRVR